MIIVSRVAITIEYCVLHITGKIDVFDSYIHGVATESNDISIIMFSVCNDQCV